MLQHKHLIVRAEVNSPPFDETRIVVWLKKLVDDLGMNILYGPFAMRCDLEDNEGYTAGCVLSTSHCMLHTWDASNPAIMQLDIYTCSDLDLNVAWRAIKEFEPSKVEYKFLDRELSLIELDEKISGR